MARLSAGIRELGEPARRVRMIGCGNAAVYVVSPRAVRVLNRYQPVGCSMSGGQGPGVSTRRVPRNEPAQDLRGVEHRGPVRVLVDLTGGKRARGELQPEKELDASRGPVFEPAVAEFTGEA